MKSQPSQIKLLEVKILMIDPWWVFMSKVRWTRMILEWDLEKEKNCNLLTYLETTRNHRWTLRTKVRYLESIIEQSWRPLRSKMIHIRKAENLLSLPTIIQKVFLIYMRSLKSNNKSTPYKIQPMDLWWIYILKKRKKMVKWPWEWMKSCKLLTSLLLKITKNRFYPTMDKTDLWWIYTFRKRSKTLKISWHQIYLPPKTIRT
jgi:hypothetical protein